jgi:hypothetical protein
LATDEPPESPELVLHTDTSSRVDDSVTPVPGWLEQRGLTPSLLARAAAAPGYASYW